MRPFIQRAILTGVLMATASPVRAGMPEDLRLFLAATIKLSDKELAAVDKGRVVTRQLPAKDEGEIAALGIVKAKASVDAFQDLARNPRLFRAMKGVEQIGLFSPSPVVDDLQSLDVPKQDIDALKKCKPASCDVKLTDETIARVATVDWDKPDAKLRVMLEFKKMMAALAAAYQSGGIDALGTVVDKKEPKSRADEFNRLQENSPYLYDYLPRGSFEPSTATLYWTKDTFSPKPVISINAAALTRSGDQVFWESRLLAASHYFNAGLDACIAVPADDGSGIYILEVYRVRIDPPTGMMAGAGMKRVEKGIVEGVGKSLEGIRAKLKD
jgi:hypothetical protein